MPRHPGRSGAAWNRARAVVLVPGCVCHLCGRPLDFEAPARTRWSPSVDHLVPLKTTRRLDPETQKHLATDPAFLRPAHFGCNSRRQAQPLSAMRGRRASRRW